MSDASVDNCQKIDAITSKRTKEVDQLSHKLVHVLPIGDVVFYGAGLIFPMPADEVIQSVLSAAHCDDFGAFLDKPVGHCGANAGCSTDHEDGFVLESHLWDRMS